MKYAFRKIMVLFSTAMMTGSLYAATVVKPELAQTVALSNTDINRVVCQNGEINDVFFSQEKGVTVVNKGSNAFVKYLVKQTSDGNEYVSTSTEIHIICNGETYTLIGQPSTRNAQTVYLSPGQSQSKTKNQARYGGLALEEKIVQLTRQVFRNEIDENFSIDHKDQAVKVYPADFKRAPFFEGLAITHTKTVKAEGLGLTVKEYLLEPQRAMQVQETDFLEPDLGTQIISITLSDFELVVGSVARLIIVTRDVVAL